MKPGTVLITGVNCSCNYEITATVLQQCNCNCDGGCSGWVHRAHRGSPVQINKRAKCAVTQNLEDTVRGNTCTSKNSKSLADT